MAQEELEGIPDNQQPITNNPCTFPAVDSRLYASASICLRGIHHAITTTHDPQRKQNKTALYKDPYFFYVSKSVCVYVQLEVYAKTQTTNISIQCPSLNPLLATQPCCNVRLFSFKCILGILGTSGGGVPKCGTLTGLPFPPGP